MFTSGYPGINSLKFVNVIRVLVPQMRKRMIKVIRRKALYLVSIIRQTSSRV
jgi:hypothetical protein